MYVCMHACMHAWMDGWMDESINGRMDVTTHTQYHVSQFSFIEDLRRNVSFMALASG